MKIIALMAVKNEEWVLELSLRAVLQVVDEVFVIDHSSTDGTAAIIKKIAEEQPGRVHTIKEVDPVWREAAIRQRLLEEGRRLGGTHFVALDADELLTGNQLETTQRMLAALEPGDCLVLPSVELWGELGIYRQDDSNLLNDWILFAFHDARSLHYAPYHPGFELHTRRPHNVVRDHKPLATRSQGGVFHLTYANRRRQQAKNAWYKMMETVCYPGRSTIELLNHRYHHDFAESGTRTAKVNPSWWQPYEAFLPHVDMTVGSWHETECRRLWQEHGPETFKGLRLWGVPQGQPDEIWLD